MSSTELATQPVRAVYESTLPLPVLLVVLIVKLKTQVGWQKLGIKLLFHRLDYLTRAFAALFDMRQQCISTRCASARCGE